MNKKIEEVIRKSDPGELNRKRIEELRERIRNIHRPSHRSNFVPKVTNAGDAIPTIQKEIRRLGGKPDIYAPRMR